MPAIPQPLTELVAALAEARGLRFGAATEAGTRALRTIVAQTGDDAPEVVLGVLHQASLDARSRRALGAHYTPRDWVRRVIEAAFEIATLPSELCDLRVLDPAMGSGAFLCETLRCVLQRYRLPDTVESRRSIARRCLFGVDRDAAAVYAARRALWLLVGDDALPEGAFDAQLVVGDSLMRATEPGFHLVLGNPPYLGGKRIRTIHGDAYANALVERHPGTNKNCDLAAHFLRLGLAALKPSGALGYVVTNTIAQGDTREGGLGWLLRNGATIARAERRVAWPGAAGVTTSLLWIKKEKFEGKPMLDGAAVDHIDAFLSAHGQARDPARLAVMKSRAFIGCFLRGEGFVFDDEKSGATPLRERDRILTESPASARFVRPFLGGREIMNSPSFSAHRSVINFGEAPLVEARKHPALVAILEAKVRPYREARRDTKADLTHAARWWQFANPRPRLMARLERLPRCIVIPRVTTQVVAVRVSTDAVFSDQLVVVASDSAAVLALLTSRVHGAWARLTCSTLGEGMRYTPSDTFETFPIPFASFEALEADTELGGLGEAFETARATAMVKRGVGVTALLRALRGAHSDADLEAVRDAWVAIDRAVLARYGIAVDTARNLDNGRSSFSPEVERQVVAALLARNQAAVTAGTVRR